MNQTAQTFKIKLNLSGKNTLWSPAQCKLLAPRLSFAIWVQKTPNLELKVELPSAEWERLSAYFDLDTNVNVQRFRLKSEVLETLLPHLHPQIDTLTLLDLEETALLKLENYDLLGISAWFEDEAS